ncbi:MAG: hypothetical protein ACOY4H_01035 [Thermodesulfobacteriota bacterium]
MKKANAPLPDSKTAPLVFGLHGRMDKKAVYLRISRDPRYRKPRLPFSGSATWLHRQLEPWKIACVCLEESLPETPGVDFQRYRHIRALYRCEVEDDFHAEQCVLGKRWLDSGAPYPMTVEGFCLFSWSGQLFVIASDLSPLPDVAALPFPKDFDLNLVGPLSVAAGFYNHYVAALYEKGYLLFPSFLIEPPLLHLVHPFPEESTFDI